DDDGERLARGRVGGDGLAYQFQDDDKDGRDDKTGKTQEETAEAAQKSITTRRTIKPSNGKSGGTPQARDPGFNIDETDLNAGGGAFDPDQFFEVYKKNTLGVNLCYNSALKRDPLLSVTNAQVFLTVKTDGTVSSVSIPALTGTELGGCLTKRIKSWRFPKSSDGGSGVLKVIFKS
ncbi:MAG TPA: AgmX/PglI C-terminal domain-containing protein, partial [Kofleriaceae bacterium]|nr:AgmX/PglI C-terminal domain-containing protein [Kofleriaceae bacterium]